MRAAFGFSRSSSRTLVGGCGVMAVNLPPDEELTSRSSRRHGNRSSRHRGFRSAPTKGVEMAPTVTRRTLLRSIGVAGGAGVMFESMRALGLVASPEALATPDYRPPAPGDLPEVRRGRKVVVLGAGMAGLVTAYELGKAGYDCVILEAKDRVGGRNWTIRGGTRQTDLDGNTQTARFSQGAYLNAGPARLPQSHITLDYCRELGVPVEVFVN